MTAGPACRLHNRNFGTRIRGGGIVADDSLPLSVHVTYGFPQPTARSMPDPYHAAVIILGRRRSRRVGWSGAAPGRALPGRHAVGRVRV
jgi:hypothetical protein